MQRVTVCIQDETHWNDQAKDANRYNHKSLHELERQEALSLFMLAHIIHKL